MKIEGTIKCDCKQIIVKDYSQADTMYTQTALNYRWRCPNCGRQWIEPVGEIKNVKV